MNKSGCVSHKYLFIIEVMIEEMPLNVVSKNKMLVSVTYKYIDTMQREKERISCKIIQDVRVY